MSGFATFREQLNPCLNCGKKMDSLTGRGRDGKPVEVKVGDIALCLYCGHLMALDENRKLRELTDKEIVAVAGDPEVLCIQKARALLGIKPDKK